MEFIVKMKAGICIGVDASTQNPNFLFFTNPITISWNPQSFSHRPRTTLTSLLVI